MHIMAEAFPFSSRQLCGMTDSRFIAHCQAKGMLSKYRYKQTGIYLCQKFIRIIEEPHSNGDKQAGRNDSRKEKKNQLLSYHIKRHTAASTVNIKPVISGSLKK